MDPAGDLTLGDMMLTLAERMGWHKRPTGNDNRAQLPDDPYLRDRLLRAVNAGRRETYRRMPTARCFKPRLSVQTDPTALAANIIAGDSSKYALPFPVQGLAGGAWNWSLLANPGYGGILQQRHSSDIATMHHTANSAGLQAAPRAMAFTMATLANPSEPTRRTAWFVWIYPKPDQVYVLEGQVRIMYAPLHVLGDLEPMGQQHTDTLIIAAERDIKMNHPDLTQREEINARFNEAVAVSIRLDNEQGPQTLGVGVDPDVERQRSRWTSPWPDRAAMVTHINGVPVAPGL